MSMKLSQQAFDYAMKCITEKNYSLDEYEHKDMDTDEMCSLGMDEETNAYAYSFSKGKKTYAKAFSKISKDADEAGDKDIKEAADLLSSHISKEEPEAEKPDGSEEDMVAEPKHKKVHKTFNVLKNKKDIAALNTLINKSAEENTVNGFWAVASLEKADSDGDIISIDGIESNLDAANGVYLPLLAGHKMSLPDGSPPEIGRVEQLLKTTIGGLKALCMYFTFALDENNEPMDDLVAKYYKRYKSGYASTFSVGMESLDEPQRIPQGGYMFNRTNLFEVSAVAIPANDGARALTRSAEEDTSHKEVVKHLMDIKETFKTFEARLDTIEATMGGEEPEEEKVETVDTKSKKVDLSNIVKDIEDIFSKYKK